MPKVTTFSFIWRFLRLQPWKFFFIFILSLSWTLDSLTWPYIIRNIVDIFTQYDNDRYAAWDSLKPFLIAGGCLWFFVEAFFRIRDFLRASALPKMEAEMRMAMFDHVQRHSPHYFNEHFAGSLSNKVSDMVSQVSSMLQNVMVFIPAIASGILSIVIFAELNPFFAAIIGAWIAIHFSISTYFAFKVVKYSDEHGEARSDLVGRIVDSFTNNYAVNMFYRFNYEKHRIADSQAIEKAKNYRALYIVAKMFSILSVLFIVAMLILNALIIHFWMQSKITSGEAVQVFYTNFHVIMIMWFAGDLLPQFFKSIGVANQALTVMNDPQDVVDVPYAKPLEVKSGNIVFEDVSFKYGDKAIFTKKNVHIKGGEKVGLVGYSGAGKSTFINLILRFYPVKEGRILIDGQDIAAVTLESLRNEVTLIPQDPLLFHRALEDNIQYGNLETNKADIVYAAQLAHCDEFIRKTPHGYQSLVGERGTKLSGGERQRIAIARAMLTKSPILILDEATSSLDSVTEKYIQESLEKVMQNRTTLVIAHRLSTLAQMDRILVFDQGQIVEEGSHAELLTKRGHYARMWTMQAGGFLPDTSQELPGNRQNG